MKKKFYEAKINLRILKKIDEVTYRSFMMKLSDEIPSHNSSTMIFRHCVGLLWIRKNFQILYYFLDVKKIRKSADF